LNDGDGGFVTAGFTDFKDGFEIRAPVSHIGKRSGENQREDEDARKIFQHLWCLVACGVRVISHSDQYIKHVYIFGKTNNHATNQMTAL
jgi:hypothetical protein